MDRRGSVKAGDCIFFKKKSSIGKRIFLKHRRVSPVKRVDFVSDRMSYIVLRGF